MSAALYLLAQSEEAGGILSTLVILALMVVVIAGAWKTFEKANQPGWGILVPIYNVILMLRIAGKPTWWIVLFLIPIVSIVVAVLVAVAIARNFGKGAGFGLGLALLPFVFYPILSFGAAEYNPMPEAGPGLNFSRAYEQVTSVGGQSD